MKKSITVIIAFTFLISLQISAQIWSTAKRLTWTADHSMEPSIATDSGNGIHVVWNDRTPGNGEIFYKHSSDVGTTWSGSTRLTWNTGWSDYPSIATDIGSGIHVVWRDKTPGNNEIFYKNSSNGGTTWSGPTRLTWNAGDTWHPDIATDNSMIHVVWDDWTPGSPEIFYKRSTDGGATWSGLKRLTWTVGWSEYPSLATDSAGGIHVVWHVSLGGNPDIFYKRSSDAGATWSGRIRLTWNAGISRYASIATDSGSGIHVVWQDANDELFYKRSSDEGTTWSGPTRLTWSDGSWFPAISTDGSWIHLVWRDSTLGNREIFYKHSSDGGTTWSGRKRLTWKVGESKSPSIATDSAGGIHVVWEDLKPGGFEILYKNRK